MIEFIPLCVTTIVFFCLCFIAMAIRLIIKGKKMRGGCGSEPDEDSNAPADCDTCAKLRVNICECDDDSGLARASATATLGRFDDDLDRS